MPSKLRMPEVSVKQLAVSGAGAFRIPVPGNLPTKENEETSKNPKKKSSERVETRIKTNRSQVIERFGLFGVR